MSSNKLCFSAHWFIRSEPWFLYGDVASLFRSKAMSATQLKSPPKIVLGVMCGTRFVIIGILSGTDWGT